MQPMSRLILMLHWVQPEEPLDNHRDLTPQYPSAQLSQVLSKVTTLLHTVCTNNLSQKLELACLPLVTLLSLSEQNKLAKSSKRIHLSHTRPSTPLLTPNFPASLKLNANAKSNLTPVFRGRFTPSIRSYLIRIRPEKLYSLTIRQAFLTPTHRTQTWVCKPSMPHTKIQCNHQRAERIPQVKWSVALKKEAIIMRLRVPN